MGDSLLATTQELDGKIGLNADAITTISESVGTNSQNIGALSTKVDAASADRATLKQQLQDANERIAEIERKLKEVGAVTSSAQANLGMPGDEEPMPDDDFTGYDYPQGIATSTSELADANKNLLVYCLVIFNIGTILGCISCLYWRQKSSVKEYKSVVPQFEEEEMKALA